MKAKKTKTDWTKYYQSRKSFFSTQTQKSTNLIINRIIKDWVLSGKQKGIEVLELGGGNSCFAEKICDTYDLICRYDIIDSNAYAVRLFNQNKLACAEQNGYLIDLIQDNVSTQKQYDFVFSIGLIEHFRGGDITKLIDCHFDLVKPGGIVLISFPTPTRKYLFFRGMMQLLGFWRFYDEKPLRYDEVVMDFLRHGTINEHFINLHLPLTQYIVVATKKENR